MSLLRPDVIKQTKPNQTILLFAVSPTKATLWFVEACCTKGFYPLLLQHHGEVQRLNTNTLSGNTMLCAQCMSTEKNTTNDLCVCTEVYHSDVTTLTNYPSILVVVL